MEPGGRLDWVGEGEKSVQKTASDLVRWVMGSFTKIKRRAGRVSGKGEDWVLEEHRGGEFSFNSQIDQIYVCEGRGWERREGRGEEGKD